MLSKRIFKSTAAIVLSVLLAYLSCVSSWAIGIASGKVTLRSDTLPETAQKLTDGIYSVRNCKTGEYIRCYDLSIDADGSAVLSESQTGDATSFLIRLKDDGTYVFYPQNDGGVYSLCYSPDILERTVLIKTKTATKYSEFRLNRSGDAWLISPAFTIDPDLVLGISSKATYVGDHYVGIEVYKGELDQKWELVRVSADSLLISTGFITVGVGASSRLYASSTPSYLSSAILWTSDDNAIASVDSDGTVHGLKPGVTTVRGFLGNLSVSAVVSVTSLKAFAWYSQHNFYSGGWNTNGLSGLYLRSISGWRKLFFLNGYNGTADWMDEGCKICCIAMVLRNLDARLAEGYDIRTGESGNLVADPFTVVLANVRSDGTDLAYTLGGSPVEAAYGNISSRFFVNGKVISTSVSGYASKAYIKSLLDEHPEGVIVGFKNYARGTSHYLVFTECVNPDASPYDYEFRVCDPASSDPATGNNVLFSESYSYRTIGYRYYNIADVQVYDVIG